MLQKIVYWASLAFIIVRVGPGAVQYFIDPDKFGGFFETLGFPMWVMYVLGVFKILGILVLLFVRWGSLKEWAYAGFMFNFLLALGAYLAQDQGKGWGLVILLVVLFLNYFVGRRLGSPQTELGPGLYLGRTYSH